MEKKTLVSICVIGLMLVSSGISVSATRIGNEKFSNNMSQPITKGITNITVLEAWELLDGDCTYEIPIDVRRNDEWNPERINTSIPEHPRHYNLHLLQDPILLEKFVSLYDGFDIVVYCKAGGRSWAAANLINDAGFTGKIYNMVGGITDWIAEGLSTAPGGILNITVDDVKTLCTDTGNGIHIPIDVRYDYEWYAGFINTPWPESPVWYTKPLLETPGGLQEFLEDYEGNEVILYCKGGYRSLLASYILMGNEFNGTIYNMLGGITAWQGAGFPIRNNTAPDAPGINGPDTAGAGVNITIEFSTSDAENDGVCYIIDWGDGTNEETDMHSSSATVSMIHQWEEKGTYIITAKAVDFYGNESENATFEIKIPRNRAYRFDIIEMLFEKFPNISAILKYLLEL
jgi:rhodanese-related sulfurtransferase